LGPPQMAGFLCAPRAAETTHRAHGTQRRLSPWRAYAPRHSSLQLL